MTTAANRTSSPQPNGNHATPTPKSTFRSSLWLNYTHFVMKEVAGYLLHPSIPTRDKKLRIADIGTGTAVWALETAAQYPDAAIDGFDITDEHFTHLSGIKNVRLFVHDCFEQFPAEYLGRYDVVHLRFLLFGINNPDAAMFLENMISLLKPGGHIQWMERLPSSVGVHRPNRDLETPFLDSHCKIWIAPRPYYTYDWTESLPTLFTSDPLSLITSERHSVGFHRSLWRLSNLAVYEDLAQASQVGKEKLEDIRRFISKLEEEMKQGASVETTFSIVVGRKKRGCEGGKEDEREDGKVEGEGQVGWGGW